MSPPRRALASLGPLLWPSISLATLVAAAIRVNGYAFGVADHAIHLPFLLRVMDPGFLPHDPLVNAGDSHPSLFWLAQAPLLRWVSFERFYLALHVLSWLGCFAGTAALGRALYRDARGRWAALLAPIALLRAKQTATWIPTLDELVLNRTVSLGPLLFALAAGAAQRWGLAFFLVGATFNVHPTTAAHAGVLLACAALAQPGRLRALGRGCAAFLLGALPLLTLMVRHHSSAGVPFPPSAEWLKLVRLQVWFHHFASSWSYQDNYSHLLAPLALLIAGLALAPSRTALAYVAGVAACCAAGVVGVEVVHYPAALHLHLLEATRFLSYLAPICAVAYAATTWPWSLRRPPWAALAVAAYALNQDLACAALSALALAWRVRGEPRPAWTGRRAAALAAAATALVVGISPWRRFEPSLSEKTGARAMAWAREHLPEQAIVAVPPYMIHPVASFRFGARRAIVGTFKDGGEGSFNQAYMHEWRERMEALCACRPFEALGAASAYDDWDGTIQRILAGYRAADAARFREIQRRFGATHALVEKSPTRDYRESWERPAKKLHEVIQPDLPLVYEDDEYAIYAILP